MDDPVAGQNLATSRDRAETGSEVERSPAVTASHRDCFSCIHPDPDVQRKSWIAHDRVFEGSLKRDGTTQRISCRRKDAERFISSQLDDLTIVVGHDVLTEKGKA